MLVPDAIELAKAFCDEMVDHLSADALAQVRKRNSKEKNPGVCHSHDFCDANMVMAAAWHKLGYLDGVDYSQALYDALVEDGLNELEAQQVAERRLAKDGREDALAQTWNKAWHLAKVAGFDPTKVRDHGQQLADHLEVMRHTRLLHQALAPGVDWVIELHGAERQGKSAHAFAMNAKLAKAFRFELPPFDAFDAKEYLAKRDEAMAARRPPMADLEPWPTLQALFDAAKVSVSKAGKPQAKRALLDAMGRADDVLRQQRKVRE